MNANLPVNSESVDTKRDCIALEFVSKVREWILLEEQFHPTFSEDSHPSECTDFTSARRAYLLQNLVKKFPYLDQPVPPRSVAEQEWVRCEKACALTNKTFRDTLYSGTPAEWSILCSIREKVREILGPVVSLDGLDYTMSPGSTYDVKGDVGVVKKLTLKPTVTSDCLSAFLGSTSFPLWKRVIRGYHVATGSRLSFVPKSSKTERPICIEPTINSILQRGVGTYMKGRLRRHGCDLRNQNHNRNLSSFGTITGHATVDFKSASDMISYEVVKWLLPWEWFELLSSLRSESYDYLGKNYAFNKFSSMGCGFTFELESLIFYATARVCVEHTGSRKPISVYGDDVVIPREALTTFFKVVAMLGFTVNGEKSYSDGPFRESCGLDTWQGRCITPFRIKERIVHDKDIYWLTNSFLSWLAEDEPLTNGADNIIRWLVHLIPRSKRYLIPAGRGDGGFLCRYDDAKPRIIWRKRYQSSWIAFTEVQDIPVKRAVPKTSSELVALWGTYWIDQTPQPSFQLIGGMLEVDWPMHQDIGVIGYSLRGKVRHEKRTVLTQEWVEPLKGVNSFHLK